MDRFSPAVAAARRAVVASGAARIIPVVDCVPADLEGAVLLVDEAPSAARFDELAAAVGRASAVVIWAPGWDQDSTLGALADHALSAGSVDMLSRPEPGALIVLVRDGATAARLVTLAAAQAQRPPFRALAIMPAFNEADVIYHAIGGLVAGGVDVYLIDHESTDGTAQAAAPWLGRGLVRIERFPEEAGYGERNHGEMVWREILRRVQDVSTELPADWYLFVNADEFREAPWPGVTLAEGLREVDELGYSAINFELFNFRPIDDGYVPGEDPRIHLRHYEPPGRHDLLQVKAWKHQPGPVDLVHHGGHDLLFDGKRVFPVPFLLRHYPIRSSEHGRRKVLAERLPRFAAEERAGGWHVQYDHYADGSDYLHDVATLTEWDSARVRSELLSDAVRRLVLTVSLSGVDVASGQLDAAKLSRWMERRGARIGGSLEDLQRAQERLLGAANGTPEAGAVELNRAAAELGLVMESAARLRGDMVGASTLGDARERLASANGDAALRQPAMV
jgi:hypothetical protein